MGSDNNSRALWGRGGRKRHLEFADKRKLRIFIGCLCALGLCLIIVPLALCSSHSFATDIPMDTREQFIRKLTPRAVSRNARAQVTVHGKFPSGVLTVHLVPSLVPVAYPWRERVIAADAAVTLNKDTQYAHYTARLNANSTLTFTVAAAASVGAGFTGSSGAVNVLAMTDSQFTLFKRYGHTLHDKKKAKQCSFARLLNIKFDSHSEGSSEATLTGTVPEDGLTHFVLTAGKIDDDDDDDDHRDDGRLRHDTTTVIVRRLAVVARHYATALATSTCTPQPRAVGSNESTCTLVVPEPAPAEGLYLLASYGDTSSTASTIEFTATLKPRTRFALLVTLIIYSVLAGAALVGTLACIRLKYDDDYMEVDMFAGADPAEAAPFAPFVNHAPAENVEQNV